MILGDALTPLSQLSSAFLAPKTPLHLQFAYFESRSGRGFPGRAVRPAAMKGLLDDLGAGISDQREPAASDENVARSIR